jgi:hypothetical protein
LNERSAVIAYFGVDDTMDCVPHEGIASSAMRWFARSLVLAAVVIVLASSSCSSSKTGKACTSAHGTCLYPPGGAACATQAPSSAQDCISGADQGGWVCCLVPVEADLDGSADGGGETPTADASGDASTSGSSDGASPAEAGDAASSDGSSPGDAGDATSVEEAGMPDEDAND